MGKKTQAAYARLFELAVNMVATVVCDFERALQNSLAVALPAAYIHGCFFHYGQAIWHKCQRIGLAPHYHNMANADVCDARKFVKQVIALPLLSAGRIVEVVRVLEATIDAQEPAVLRPMLRQLVRYLDWYWIGVVGVERLSVFGLNKCSNNYMESLHRYWWHSHRGWRTLSTPGFQGSKSS